MSVITDFLTNFTQFFAPDVAVNPAATASATTALQGQFSTVDSSTVMAVRATTTTTINVRLRKSRAPGSAVDTTSPLTILIDAGLGNTITAPTLASTGTLMTSIPAAASRWSQITVMPDATGKVTIAITSSADAATRVQLRHRTFATSIATLT